MKNFCFFWRIGEFLKLMLVFIPGGGGAAQWGGALLPIIGPPGYPPCAFGGGIDGAVPCGGRIPLNVLFCIGTGPAGGGMLLPMPMPMPMPCC